MRACLVAGKGTVPDAWVDALPVEELDPLLRRIVRNGEEGSAARDAARHLRWAAGREETGAAEAAGKQ